ncbi:MAG: glycosyltransferase [Candidatus Nomurabacteria bacterium]|nr:glycosyltransferase [Candidatus Nomurabacteria bacterium]
MKKHIIIASYDGLSTFYCGVGTIAKNTVATLNNYAKDNNIRVSIAYITASPEGKAYSKESYSKSLSLVNKTQGFMVPLCNGTKGLTEWDMWRSFPEWNYVSASLATSLNLILKEDEENILMLHDTPFLLFSKFKDQVINKNLKCYYLPHSSGLNHVFGNKIWRDERVHIEKECFTLINQDKNSRVIATGNSFGEHLFDNYGLRFTMNDYLKNGLSFSEYAESLKMNTKFEDISYLNQNLNSGSKIIFSWGRCSVAKGFKELIDAWAIINNKLSNHFLILQAPNNSGEDEYYSKLIEMANVLPRVVVVNNFNQNIWKSILRYKNTDIVCLPSLMDPNPHTPIEAKLFMKDMNYVIVASDKDGVKDSFEKNECYLVDPLNIDMFAETLYIASNTTIDNRKNMSKLNENSVKDFDYSNNLINFLENI